MSRLMSVARHDNVRIILVSNSTHNYAQDIELEANALCYAWNGYNIQTPKHDMSQYMQHGTTLRA